MTAKSMAIEVGHDVANRLLDLVLILMMAICGVLLFIITGFEPLPHRVRIPLWAALFLGGTITGITYLGWGVLVGVGALAIMIALLWHAHRIKIQGTGTAEAIGVAMGACWGLVIVALGGFLATIGWIM